MSCVPCADACSAVSKDDLDRWTNSLKHVMANQTSAKMFEDYLRTCKLDSADILVFWKMCDGLLRYMHHKKIDKYVLHLQPRRSVYTYFVEPRVKKMVGRFFFFGKGVHFCSFRSNSSLW